VIRLDKMKKKTTLVSILIINYNNSDLIDRSIRSCLNQTYQNIEILVFDDKSTDGSLQKLRSYYKNKKIKIFVNKKKKKNIPSFDAFNGYNFLFKKSKGSIICLLDSDDFFHLKKVNEVVKCFKKNKKINFIQNLPVMISKKKNKFYKKNKNSIFSSWPYLAPESCISFKRNLMTNFLKKNKNYKKKYDLVWTGFRMGVYTYFLTRSFFTIKQNLTFYESLGESKKYKTLGKNWFLRRFQSYKYLQSIMKDNKHLRFNLDYFITKIIVKFLKVNK